jgi:hypothetical protein
MNDKESTKLLDSFMERWSLDNVKKMSLQEYVGVNNHNTFCYWVETETRILGSIKGSSSFLFGIYERKEKSKQYSGRYKSDEKYAWEKKFGENRNETFENVKNELIKIINCAETGDFAQIDNIKLHSFFKWKVAFLYSNERLIPIYEREILEKIAESFGLVSPKKASISNIQELMMQNKPANLSVNEYMQHLWDKFGQKDNKDESNERIKKRQENKPKTRRATEIQIVKNQVRNTASRSYFVEQRHKKLQLALKEKLIKEYGEDSVILFEENNVDVKLFQPNQIIFYEVKTAAYATNCIREALGQLLHYSFSDKDLREKKLLVVGQYPPNLGDREYIAFIKKTLNIDFDYENVEID